MTRAMTASYLLALGVIASLAMTSHLLTERLVRQQASTARVAILAGRQGLLCQRVMQVSQQIAAGTNAVVADRQTLLVAAAGVDEAEAALMHGDPSLGVPPAAATAVRELYLEPPYLLDRRLSEFLASARKLAAKSEVDAADPELRSMAVTLERFLLPGLEHAVWQYQQDAEAGVAHLNRVLSTLTWTMLVVLALEALLIYQPLYHRLTHVLHQVLQGSSTDTLTRVLNCHTFLQHADAELNRARQAGAPTALIMADLDDFRRLNDRHGHAAGDLALRHFAAIAQSNLRSNDRIGRLGGEEFAILLCGTPLEGAVMAAERIRERLAGSTAALMPDNFRVFITCSFGVTVSAADEQIADLLTRADAQLHRAKNQGRNRVESAPPLPAPAPMADASAPLAQRSTA